MYYERRINKRAEATLTYPTDYTRLIPSHFLEPTMQFGITIAPHIDRWDLIQYAEELGFDRAWVPDSQMIWSDCYSILALAAVNTCLLYTSPSPRD